MQDDTKDDGVVIFETRMQVKAYINMGDGITLEQADSMGNDAAFISFGCDDVEAVVNVLRSLKKQIREQLKP